MSAPPVPDAPSPFDASWRQEAGAGLDADGLALIDQAVAWSVPRFEGQQALTGEPLASHGAGVVRILAGLHTDAATRAAALLAALPTDLTAPA
ncbi:HD domain-containing protein, partial [Achromobacter xylosoxidans]